MAPIPKAAGVLTGASGVGVLSSAGTTKPKTRKQMEEEAAEAFYRQRSKSLRSPQNYTASGRQAPKPSAAQPQQPSGGALSGIFERISKAFPSSGQ